MSAPRSLAPALLLAIGLCVSCGGATAPTASPVPTDDQTNEPTAALTTPPPVSTTAPPTSTGSASPTDNDIPGGPMPDVSRIAKGETPAGWKEVKTTDGACRMAVPADWETETLPGTATAPNFGGQVILSNDSLATYGSWEQYTQAAQAAYFGADKQVLVNTGALFVMAAGPSSPGASVLVGANRLDSVCGVLLTITANGVADLLDSGFQILYSLGATG